MNINDTIYNAYFNAQKDNSEKVALYTRDGETVSHGRLLEEIDKAAAWLHAHLCEGQCKIGVLSSCSYEEAVFLLAASKVGAISKFIDFTKNISEIGESIEESSIDVLVMGAEFLPMEPYINPSMLPVIVLGDIPSARPHYCAYSDILKMNAGSLCPPAPYREGACAVIINSSGTTGTPKPIELSDRALNAAVEKMLKTDYPLVPENLILKIIPSFLGMGLITTLYTCLVVGIPVIYFVAYGPKGSIDGVLSTIITFPSFLQKYGLPASTKLLLFASPMFYRGIYQLIDQVSDLSFLGCMLAGGSSMGKEELEVLDAVFASKGCTVPVMNGYGQNEMAGAVTLNQIGRNRRGSAGTAVDGTDLMVVDLQDFKPLPCNAVGKILERSESLFIGYENMPERTEASFITDENGDSWFDTNDVGYLDDDGFLFITGRASRIIIRLDMKVSLDKMEEKIRASKFVKEAGVISVKGDIYDTTVAFVTLKDEFCNAGISPEQIIEDIQQSRNPLSDREATNHFVIVDALPYRSSGKIDYRTLEALAAESNR